MTMASDRSGGDVKLNGTPSLPVHRRLAGEFFVRTHDRVTRISGQVAKRTGNRRPFAMSASRLTRLVRRERFAVWLGAMRWAC